MISIPYPSKGTARSAAKEHAEENGLKNFILMVDLEKRKYHFSDEEKAPDPKLIVFARYKLSKGKWQDRPVLAKGAS